jgi:hypothetical protein
MNFKVLRASVIAVLLSGGGIAHAAIYDSGGFEGFTNNQDLTGQDPVNGPWVKSGTNTSTATVQSAVTASGTRAVQMVREAALNGDARWAVLKPSANVATPIAIDWDMNVTQSSVPAGSFGPFFGAEGYDSLDNGGGGPLLAGSFGVDSKTGELLYQQSGTGFLVAVPNVTVPFGQWNHFRLLLDYSNATYSIYYNGALEATEPFVDPNIGDFTDAPISTFAAGGDAASLAAGGTAYFDNYTINQVPEPTLVGVGMVSLVFFGRRRNNTGARA